MPLYCVFEPCTPSVSRRYHRAGPRKPQTQHPYTYRYDHFFVMNDVMRACFCDACCHSCARMMSLRNDSTSVLPSEYVSKYVLHCCNMLTTAAVVGTSTASVSTPSSPSSSDLCICSAWQRPRSRTLDQRIHEEAELPSGDVAYLINFWESLLCDHLHRMTTTLPCSYGGKEHGRGT
jgi:hypothetical protein